MRAALAVDVRKNFVIHQMDVHIAFLHGDIDSEVYVTPPEGCGLSLWPGQALKLRKGMYGLKKAPRLWYNKWTKVIWSLRFEEIRSEPCLYKTGMVWILLYVDDVISMAPSEEMANEVKKSSHGELYIKDIGELYEFLGV